MPNINTMKESRFLKKEDCGPGILRTIAGCTQQNLAMEGEPAQMEYVLTFSEPDTKPFVLKSVNAQIIAGFLGSEETDDWIGRKIVLYHDTGVMMKGKIVGGIRTRAPRGPAAQANPAPRPQQLPPAAEQYSEDVPY